MTILTLRLEPLHRSNRPTTMKVDFENGTLRGDGAEYIRNMAVPGAWIPMNPPPQYWQLPAEPLRDPASVAVLIAMVYRLPPELAAFLPPQQKDDGEPPDVEVTY